jgi:hypothetical protein
MYIASFRQFEIFLELTSASILYSIKAKRTRVRDHAYAVLKTKEKDPAADAEPTLRTKIA